MTDRDVASPLSTGGAGTFFEQHVAAYWLTQLLVRSIPPILIDSNVVEVSFQTEHLGWQTDDFLVICAGLGTTRRALAGQVKRSFTVSASNEECKKAVLDFWMDYQAGDRFSSTRDRLVLVVQLGTDVLLRDFGGLLECARASRDPEDFQRRLSTPGFIAKRAIRYCEELCKIVAEHEGRAISGPDLWPFLRILHVLSLDLDTSTRHTEAHVKALLAHTFHERDPSAMADSSWSSLLALASSAMSHARTFRWEDLPEELRQRHSVLDGTEERLLRALREHTAPILRRIRSTIGPNLHLERGAVVQNVLDELETAQVVIVSGPAGCGKSAVGRDVADRLAPDHFVFAFRVEEFAQPHIDATLQSAQIPGSAETVAAILAAQTRKLVLIESVERLLEKTTRDAFSDLMAQAAADPDLRLVLTCRDYSTEQVRASFLRPSGLSHTVVTVPPLDDEELTHVASTVPNLVEPLKSERLRNLLRNPFYLDKALGMPWPAERPMPETERDFRMLFWRLVVRGEAGPALGIGRRREEVLQQIAIRRARALTDYIPVNEFDPEVIASLRRDSLIVSPEDNLSRIATAHDVLEDWAILQWLEELHLAGGPTLQGLCATIGTHPAIRRSYRKWLAELLEREPASADRLFTAATSDSDVTTQFRDDTLIALLKAPLAPQLLARHEAQLVANDLALLKRVVHLLRVACVATPEWLRSASGYGSIFNVPDGPAWSAVLRLVHDHLQRFTAADRPLLLGLIEDAVRGVTWWAPEPEGAESVAGITYALLPELDSYRSEDARNRALKVIAKIPKVDPVRFESVLRGSGTQDRRRDRIFEEFRDLLFSGVEGAFAVRELPELMVAVAAEYLLATEDGVRDDGYHGHTLDIDIHFGIMEGLRRDFFPASALRGPWISLLTLHPRTGLEFYFRVFNHSIDWYTHPRIANPLEPAWEIELTFADGSVQKQWVNGRLWNAYRGTSVSPYALQSLLMALEKWLLQFAEEHPQQLDPLLVSILRRSQSASLSAVVASVAVAHPHAAGEALLALLSAPDYIRLDRERMVNESHASALTGMFPELNAENRIYREERDQANRLPHRRHDIEWAIANLQLGPLASRVHVTLDRYLAKLPERSKRTQRDLVWQLAIQRMDLRQYAVSEVVEDAPTSADAESESGTKYVRLEPKITDPDVQAMVEESGAKFQAMNDVLAVWMWGLKAFKREMAADEKEVWRDKLAKARLIDRNSEDEIGARNGPGVIAAVCIRDHWEEMSEDERVWCTDVACAEVMRNADRWNTTERIQRHEMAADRSCASVMAVLLTKATAKASLSKVCSALAAAITHPVEEVGWFATWGINADVWRADRATALRCVNAIAMEADILEQGLEGSRQRLWKPGEVDALYAGAAHEVRKRFLAEGGIADDAHVRVNLASRTGADAHARILIILSFVPDDPLSVTAFERASAALVREWDEDDNGRGRRRDRNFESEHAAADRIQRFVMRTNPERALRVLRTILDAVERHPRETYSIVQGLTGTEDSSLNTPQYWYLWKLFAERIKSARWVAWLDREHPTGSEMLAAIFLTLYWKDNVRHWRSLEGHAHHVDELFEALPPTAIVLDDYLRFLYHIGERSLPVAFIRIAQALQRGNAPEMLVKNNTVFMLEVLLQRHVYGRPVELKQDQPLRDAVLLLLDILVESGSSAAFRMRDDFVTPA